jgi:protein ImuB
MRRIVSIWLPRWPIERRNRARRQAGSSRSARPDNAPPFVFTIREKSALRLASLNEAAIKAGLYAGMSLADARAIVPGLAAAPLRRAADKKALKALARWCGRYSPWTALDGEDGIIMDISGCGHLFGGDAALLSDLSRRLRGMGFKHHIGLGASLGAAWAVARFGAFGAEPWIILADGEAAREEAAAVLSPLPVAALRLESATCEILGRLGLKTIGALAEMPRLLLQHRFPSRAESEAVLLRLDQLSGQRPEPLEPLSPTPLFRARHVFPEPVEGFPVIEPVLGHLIEDICALMERQGKGARRLTFEAFHMDGRMSRLTVGTAAASRNPAHLKRLFREPAARVDFTTGIDEVLLACLETQKLDNTQASLIGQSGGAGAAALFELADRLGGRLGSRRVGHLAPHQSHIPERACRRLSGLAASGIWAERRAGAMTRPFRLFEPAEAINVMAEIPDGPPLRFRWRRALVQVAKAEGPERITPEWWRDKTMEGQLRDYYRLEDGAGHRFWVYRDGLFAEAPPNRGPRWYMHGLFA